ncbi:MAG: SpoIID/LytB domain-containing protein [bacterium]|nr:SpoIID/LytB domain-containing protein [bacterium]
MGPIERSLPVDSERPTVEESVRSVRDVRVVLTALEGSPEVTVAGGRSGARKLRRVGDLVLDARGQAACVQEIVPSSKRYGLSVDGRTYRGRIIVEPHPERGLRAFNLVEIEDYVAGVVAAELVLWSAEPAELEAQAIAARTFAFYALGTLARPFLRDDALDQAYRGVPNVRGGAGAQAVTNRLELALAATRGQVLVRGGQPVDARYHAACGGRTTSHELIFGGPGAVPVDCMPCAERARSEVKGSRDPRRPLGWSTTVPAKTLQRVAAEVGIGSQIERLTPQTEDRGGRWIDVRLDGSEGSTAIAFDDFRHMVGTQRVKSAHIVRTWPAVGERVEQGLFLEGIGRGHGVGLCQEGARDYALSGWSGEQILAHYFRGARIERTQL